MIMSQSLTGNTWSLQLRLKAKDQLLAGFLIESMDGIAIHSQGETRDQLRLIYDKSTQTELDSFLKAWCRFKALSKVQHHGLDNEVNENIISSGSNDHGEIQHV